MLTQEPATVTWEIIEYFLGLEPTEAISSSCSIVGILTLMLSKDGHEDEALEAVIEGLRKTYEARKSSKAKLRGIFGVTP